MDILRREWKFYLAWAALIGPAGAFLLGGSWTVEIAKDMMLGGILYAIILLPIVRLSRNPWWL